MNLPALVRGRPHKIVFGRNVGYDDCADAVVSASDTISFLKTIPDETVGLVVTSPPYNIGKPYEKRVELREYFGLQKKVAAECWRTLKPSGSICWQVGNYYEANEIYPLDLPFYEIFKNLGMRLRNRIIWRYEHGPHATVRFSGRYETILWFTKTDNYIFNLDPVRIPQKYPGKNAYKGPNRGRTSSNPLGKNPSDIWDLPAHVVNEWADGVWNIPNVKAGHPEKTAHPAQFPIELCERLILALSNPSDRVLDPYAGCYDAQTEALTAAGWKNFSAISLEDRIATLNPITFELEYHQPLRIIRKDYKGKMYRIKTNQVNLLVTPNHNMFVSFRTAKRKRHWPFQLVPASHVFGKHVCYKKNAHWVGNEAKYFTLPSSAIGHRYGPIITNSRQIPIVDWAKFFGLWLADGYTALHKRRDSGYHQYLVGIRNSNYSLLQEIASILKKSGFNPHTYKNAGRLTMSNKQLFDYLAHFGKAWEKFVPAKIKALTPPLLSLLLHYYLKGDGWHTPNKTRDMCWTTSSRLRDDLQEIALKVGWSASYSLSTKTGDRSFSKSKQMWITAKHDTWLISFITKQNCPRVYHKRSLWDTKKYHRSATDAEERSVDYDGVIWCVEVPNHVLYVRRHGKPVWCGNSGSSLVAAVLHGRKALGADKEYTYADIARNRIVQALNGTLKRRPFGKPIQQANPNDKRVRPPPEWAKGS